MVAHKFKFKLSHAGGATTSSSLGGHTQDYPAFTSVLCKIFNFFSESKEAPWLNNVDEETSYRQLADNSEKESSILVQYLADFEASGKL